MSTRTLTILALTAMAIVATWSSTALLATSTAVAADRSTSQDVERPELIAVKFHADWCGKCQAMKPAHKSVRQAYAEKPVLFVTLDLTEPADVHQAEYLMAELNMGRIWSDIGRKTGFVILVDAESREPIGRLTSQMGEQEMSDAIAAAL